MSPKKSRGLQVLLAAVVTALIVMPVAFAGASGASGSPAKQINTLKKQTAQLRKQVAALTAQVSAIAAKPTPTVPAALPPSGPAGGDLVGTFPKPQIAANAVTGAKVANQSIGSVDIAEGAIHAVNLDNDSVSTASIVNEGVGPTDLSAGAIGSVQLGSVLAAQGDSVAVGANALGEATVTCPAGTRLLSGGFEWANDSAGITSMIYSSPSFPGQGTRTWEVKGRAGAIGNGLRATALCLKSS